MTQLKTPIGGVSRNGEVIRRDRATGTYFRAMTTREAQTESDQESFAQLVAFMSECREIKKREGNK